MHAERTQPSLETILRQEVECSQNLVQCLEAERNALTHRDHDSLENTTKDKTRLTGILEDLETQREQAIAKLGYSADAKGLRQYFSTLPEHSELPALWSTLLTNISACRDGNLANGGILEAGRQHVEQALSILRGQSGTPSIYSSEGNTSANLGQRELGKV